MCKNGELGDLVRSGVNLYIITRNNCAID